MAIALHIVWAILKAIRCWTLLHTIGNFARYHYQSNGLIPRITMRLLFSIIFILIRCCSLRLAWVCACLFFFPTFRRCFVIVVFFCLHLVLVLSVCMCNFSMVAKYTHRALSLSSCALVACLFVAWLVWAYRFILSIFSISFELSCRAPGIFIFAPLYTLTEWVKLQSNRNSNNTKNLPTTNTRVSLTTTTTTKTTSFRSSSILWVKNHSRWFGSLGGIQFENSDFPHALRYYSYSVNSNICMCTDGVMLTHICVSLYICRF